MAGKTKFITNYERRCRIEALMKNQGNMTWYALAKKMNKDRASVVRALRKEKNSRNTVTLELVEACARALGVSAGFLIDRKEVRHRVRDLGRGAVAESD